MEIPWWYLYRGMWRYCYHMAHYTTCYIPQLQLLSSFAHYASQITSASSWEKLLFPGNTKVWALVSVQHTAKGQLSVLQLLEKKHSVEKAVYMLSAHTKSHLVVASRFLLCFFPNSQKLFPLLASEEENKCEKQTGRMTSWYSAISLFN